VYCFSSWLRVSNNDVTDIFFSRGYFAALSIYGSFQFVAQEPRTFDSARRKKIFVNPFINKLIKY
jgi:hypothetical protein